MRNRSFSKIVEGMELLIAALRRNSEELAKYSIKASEIDASEAALLELERENVRQERLKADLKECTKKVEENLDVVSAKYALYKKIVKLAFPQVRWREFGITDKR